MDFIIVAPSANLVSALTLFSDFGLGTLLMPVFALFELLPRLRELKFDRRFLFAGVAIGKRFLHKVTMKTVQTLTVVLLLGIALALGSGIV